MLRKAFAAVGLCIAYLGFAIAAVGNSTFSGPISVAADDPGRPERQLVVVAVSGAGTRLSAK